jgi:hypothetical protein
MAYSASGSIVVTSVGLPVTWILVGLRLYTRKVLLRALQWDDAFAALALVRLDPKILY